MHKLYLFPFSFPPDPQQMQIVSCRQIQHCAKAYSDVWSRLKLEGIWLWIAWWSQSWLNLAYKRKGLDQAKPYSSIATWSLTGSNWRQRQPVKCHLEGCGLSVKRKMGLRRIASNFTSNLLLKYFGRVNLKFVFQSGLHLSYLRKV